MTHMNNLIGITRIGVEIKLADSGALIRQEFLEGDFSEVINAVLVRNKSIGAIDIDVWPIMTPPECGFV